MTLPDVVSLLVNTLIPQIGNKGVVAYTGGRHTCACQYFGVATAVGTVVVASDSLYLYENLEKHLPLAATLDPDADLRAQTRTLSIASSPRLIIPGHDPGRFRAVPETRG